MNSNDPREMSRSWFFENEWGFHRAPPPMDVEAFGKALITCAKADGKLAPEERRWILGYLASAGATEAQLEMLGQYEGGESLDATLSRSTIAAGGRRNIVFDALRACLADGELHEDERKAVVQIARSLGVSEDIVQALEAAYKDERAARERRLKIIYPDGLPF